MICLCSLATVSSDVFRLVGDSVQMDIQDPVPKFDELFWVFNRIQNVLKYYPEFKKTKQTPGYEGRMEFNEETYSLTLKNLQKTDSGLYEAKASGDNVTVVAEYRLSVLGKSCIISVSERKHSVLTGSCNFLYSLLCSILNFSEGQACKVANLCSKS